MRYVAVLIAAVFLVLYAITIEHPYIQAQSTTQLQSQIDASTRQINQLREEIAKLQSELNNTTKEKQTLQNAINQLNLNIQKLQKSISLTQAQIRQKDLEIGTLSTNIIGTAEKIETSESQIANSLKRLNILSAQPMVVTFLSGGSLSSFFDEAAQLEVVRTDLQEHIYRLNTLKEELEQDKSVAEDKRTELSRLNNQLSQERQGLSIAKGEQTKLLEVTKNKETTYQQQIAEKKALQAKFEQDLMNFEAQLNLIVNPGSFAAPRAGVLQWPVSNPLVTQYFGNTAFATQNPQIYGGRGHNAIDLRASPGTPIKAARSGTIRGTGNTDTTCPGASYGKWIFIDHDNGLSTLYAHLSTISVSQGQSVGTGDVIGYSDTTGYATGPHLHFGVYATSGSKITSFPSKSCGGKTYTMPVADPSAYLNPLSYLPAL
ncbi:MAG TPA: peptidoglycan DD-metalloendopeptidase family protein [Candidatus Paceibacterota bacterium]|nr:peptidoglycan DD-metalloendopeptidase family protein [Candidatus Paceibacterota bacterium]